MTYTGRCACGAVTLEIEGEPATTRQCWCRQCQTIAGGGPTHNAMFPTVAITVTGDLAENSYTAASGSAITHQFCPRCGTHVMGRSRARPHFRVVRFGVLDQGHGLKPAVVGWTQDAPDYAMIDPSLERWPQQPPAPGAPD